MEVRALGNSGLQVSRIGLGTMTWGRDTDLHEARDIFNIYYESGGRLIDTADVYADGVSEQIVGELTRDYPDVIISTKSGVVRTDRRTDLSRRNLLNSLDASLKRLRRSNIDIWHLHGWDNSTPLAETIGAIETAINSGRVQYVGVSSFAGWQLTAIKHELPSFSTQLISAQGEYSLLNRQVETELLPATQYLGVGFMAWSPLGRGVLTGKYRHNTPADSRGASAHLANFVAPYLGDRAKAIVEATCTAAEGIGASPIGISLAWALANPAVTALLVGPRTAAQMKFITSQTEIELPVALEQALAEVSF